jgi:hypothetical protein
MSDWYQLSNSCAGGARTVYGPLENTTPSREAFYSLTFCPFVLIPQAVLAPAESRPVEDRADVDVADSGVVEALSHGLELAVHKLDEIIELLAEFHAKLLSLLVSPRDNNTLVIAPRCDVVDGTQWHVTDAVMTKLWVASYGIVVQDI